MLEKIKNLRNVMDKIYIIVWIFECFYVIIYAEILAMQVFGAMRPMLPHPACLESSRKNALASKHFYS